MKNMKISLLVLTISVDLIGMNTPLPTSGGPMNAVWFNHSENPCKRAIHLHQKCRWDNAELGYEICVEKPNISEYDKHMGLLNWASCVWALGKSTEHWSSFDAVIDINQGKRISKELITSDQGLKDRLVHVRTDYIGIGDIFHFMKAAVDLKESTGCHIIFSVRDFLKNALSGFSMACDVRVVGEKEDKLPVDYETHLISLLGYLELKPQDTIPSRVLLTAPEKVLVTVDQQIAPFLSLGKNMVVAFLGEDREATLIGGKKLYGRHLDPQSFKDILKNHTHVVLIDCDKNSRVAIEDNQKLQYVKLASEEEPFDTIIALALLMNSKKNIYGFGADNGPTNVFIRALNQQAQKRMALIIPYGSENNPHYDMRMEGKGKVYQQSISHCMVYKCENPEEQNEIINSAYDDMLERDMKPDTFSFDLKPGMLVRR